MYTDAPRGLAHTRFSGTQEIDWEREAGGCLESSSPPSTPQHTPVSFTSLQMVFLPEDNEFWSVLAPRLKAYRAISRCKHLRCRGCDIILANDSSKEAYGSAWVWKTCHPWAESWPKETEASKSCALAGKQRPNFHINPTAALLPSLASFPRPSGDEGVKFLAPIFSFLLSLILSFSAYTQPFLL